MQLTKLSQVLVNNRDRIMEAKKVLDSATTISLIGASVDRPSRERIVVGTALITGGSMALGAIGLTGIAGPVLLGVAIAPVAAKLTVFSGVGMMFSGFVRGFRAGLAHVEQSSLVAAKLADALKENGVNLQNIDLQLLFGNRLVKA